MPYHIWDTPDYKDLNKKLWSVTKLATIYSSGSALWTSFGNSLPPSEKTFLYVYAKTLLPNVVGANVGMLTAYAVSKARGNVDDHWNYIPAAITFAGTLTALRIGFETRYAAGFHFGVAFLVALPVIIAKYGQNSRSRDLKELEDCKETNELKEPTGFKDEYSKAIYYKNQGNKLFKQGKFNEALDCYSKAIECCPSDKTSDLSIFYQNRAAVYEINKNYEAVIEECTQAIKLNKKYVKALSRRAKAYEALGYISDALKDITAVDILENFQNRTNLLITDRLLKELSKKKAKEFFSKRSFTDPSKHFIKNYFSSYCRDPLVNKTDDLDAHKLYSILDDLKKEKDNGAGSNVDAKIALLEGTIEIMKGNISEGENKFLQVIGIDNADADVKVNALIKLGTIKVQEVDNNTEGLDAILEFFKKAIEIDENNEDIYIHRAQIFLLADKIDEALQDLEKCCSLAPDFPSAVAQKLYVTYRIAYRVDDQEKIKESHQSFEEALKKFPNATEVYSLYAQLLTEQGDTVKADKLFLKAIEVDPADANLVVHRGILAMQVSLDFNKALDLLEEAIKIDSKCTFAHEMLGTLEVQRGNLTKGIECFDRALENASTEMDCGHLFSLREAAIAQLNAVKSLDITLRS